MSGVTREQIDSLVKRDRAAFVADFKRIVESPSVSADPAHKKDIEGTVKVATDLLRSAGAEVTVYLTRGNPVVFGRFENKKGAPTVAIYNHLDVQPATKGKDHWTREPFKFEEENGRFYSRGTTDDKGPAMTAFWAAKMAKELKLPINIEFIWELEEEIGSPNFEEFVEKAKPHIKADSILVSDTQWLAPDKPSITAGLRGLLGLVVRLRTGKKDVHSGVVGGAARNAVTELCGLVASCCDPMTGEIKIPGFSDTWKKPTKKEVDEFVATGFSVESFKRAHELKSMRTENTAEVVTRIWGSPTFEVHGIAGGYQGPGVKTIVPQEAEAKITFRLVPGQSPQAVYDVFEKHARRILPDCEILKEGVLEAYKCPEDLPQRQAVLEALEFGFGKKPASAMEGGSIGAVVTMDRILRKPILFLGLSLPEDAYHGPNESFAWSQVAVGVRSFVKYFELLSAGR